MKSTSALYIHIPFCISKCKYCDFFSIPCGKNYLIPDEYISALCNEIEYRIKKFNVSLLTSIYIGGGTPSLLNQSQLNDIFSIIRENCKISSDCEITIECNPDDVSSNLLKSFEEVGINRLSVGIQSFDDDALSYVSRRASAKDNLKALEVIRGQWKGQLSVDLICGLPKESKHNFYNDLKLLLQFKPDHISMYSLTIEDETPLGQEFNKGILNYDFDFADNLWLKGKEILKNAGYLHYEVSNFAIPNKQCRHNLKYWHHENYIGCGSGGAGSVYYDDGSGFRWTNIQNIKKYIDFWTNDFRTNSKIPQSEEKISVETSIFEFFMMGLRTIEGISLNEFENIFHQPIPENILHKFYLWKEQKLCEITKTKQDIKYSLGNEGIVYLNKFLEEIL